MNFKTDNMLKMVFSKYLYTKPKKNKNFVVVACSPHTGDGTQDLSKLGNSLLLSPTPLPL